MHIEGREIIKTIRSVDVRERNVDVHISEPIRGLSSEIEGAILKYNHSHKPEERVSYKIQIHQYPQL